MRENPWQSLPPGGSGSLSALRVFQDCPLGVFWARKQDGRYALLFTATAPIGEPDKLPRLRGIEFLWNAEERQLQLILAAVADQEMFYVLCLDLIEAIRLCESEKAAMGALLTRLGRWQRLLSRGGPRILSESEIRGLIGELCYLRNVLIPRFGVAATMAWLGPDGHPQDFAIGGVVVEVKTHSGGAVPSVLISSADQLWSESVPLYLHVITLATVSADGVCLPDLIAELTGLLDSDAALLDRFEERLEKLGYILLPEYRDYRYDVMASANFTVGEDFPRLIPSMIPPGITEVRYELRLDALAAFRADTVWPAAQGVANEY